LIAKGKTKGSGVTGRMYSATQPL